MKLIINSVSGALVAFVALSGVQLYTITVATDEARDAAILVWADANPNGAEVVKRYQQECRNSIVENPETRMPERPLTFAQCAENAGSKSLATAIEAAHQSVVIPAPLRWL